MRPVRRAAERARCLSSRDNSGRRPPSSASTASINRSRAPWSGGIRTAAMVRPSHTSGTSLASMSPTVTNDAPTASTTGFTARMSGCTTGRARTWSLIPTLRSFRHSRRDRERRWRRRRFAGDMNGDVAGTVGERRIRHRRNERSDRADLDRARRAERADLDVGAVLSSGGDRSCHVRAGSSLDERLDGELDVCHAGKRRASVSTLVSRRRP